MNSLPRISYYLSHPIQYFTPLLRRLAKKSDLHVYYFSDVSVRGGFDKGFGQAVKWDIPLLEGYESTFIKNYSSRQALDNNFLDLLNPSVPNYIRKEPARIVIINGWSYFSILLTIVAAKLMGRKVWMRAENTLSKELTKRPMVVALKKFVLGNILFRFFIDRFLYIGTDSKRFFEYYGVPENKLVFTPYSVDNDYFAAQYAQWHPQRMDLRKQFQIPADRIVILYTGKYMPVKRPLDLLAAMDQLRDLPVALVMVGDGELRGAMEQYIKERKLEHIYLTGFVNQSQISQYYSIGDIFVLCSESETWGLSTNEAMNFHMPIVLSDTVGSAADLVKEGWNGATFRKGDITDMANKIRTFVENESLRKEAGKHAAEWVKKYNYETAVDNIVAAVQ